MSHRCHKVSVVIPIYQAETTLDKLFEQLIFAFDSVKSPNGNEFQITEVLLVSDRGPDGSEFVIRELAQTFEQVRPVWLSRNFGQHAATLAGMASSTAEWIVTIDEDGQHNPRDIGVLLDAAIENGADLVYASPANKPPHGPMRNFASRSAKWSLDKIFGAKDAANYQSFRLVLGGVGRTVAAYAGAGVYLDVALGWVANRVATAQVHLAPESGRASGYSLGRLLSHYRRMILSTGTRGLRLVSGFGILLACAGFIYAAVIVVEKLLGSEWPAGWTSLLTVILISSGAILISLGVVAEYIGALIGMALGKPAYVITKDPLDGPLGAAFKGRE